MSSSVRVSLAALVAATVSLAALVGAGAQTGGAPAAAPPPPPPPAMQRWLDDHAAMLDARLAGLKAGLRLTPDQEKLWGPFEAAVRDFAALRTTRIEAMKEQAGKPGPESGHPDMAGPPPSPIDRLDRMATQLSEVGAALRKLADAGKPLYASLDDQQKRMFGFLSHEMMKMGRGRHGMGPMMGPPAHHDDHDDEGDDEE